MGCPADVFHSMGGLSSAGNQFLCQIAGCSNWFMDGPLSRQSRARLLMNRSGFPLPHSTLYNSGLLQQKAIIGFGFVGAAGFLSTFGRIDIHEM
jgi:hypothetical protein